MRSLRALIIVLVASVAFVACGADGSDRASGNGGSGPETAVAPASSGFTAALVGGGQFDGSTPRARPLAMWFWAPT